MHRLNSPKKDQDWQAEQHRKNSSGNSSNVSLMGHPIDEQEILCQGMRNPYDSRNRGGSASSQANAFVRHCNTDHDKHCLLFGNCALAHLLVHLFELIFMVHVLCENESNGGRRRYVHFGRQFDTASNKRSGRENATSRQKDLSLSLSPLSLSLSLCMMDT